MERGIENQKAAAEIEPMTFHIYRTLVIEVINLLIYNRTILIQFTDIARNVSEPTKLV